MEPLHRFGGLGPMVGFKFAEPSGIAVDAYDHVYVADSVHNAVIFFDKDGRPQMTIYDRKCHKAYKVAVSPFSGEVIVLEPSPSQRIHNMGRDNNYVDSFGEDDLENPKEITVDHRGRIIVVEAEQAKVVIFDKSGALVRKVNIERLQLPTGVSVNTSKEIFICDHGASCVWVFSYRGEYLRQIAPGLPSPFGIVVMPSGGLCIASNTDWFRLHFFAEDGIFNRSFVSNQVHNQIGGLVVMEGGKSFAVLAREGYVYRYRNPLRAPPNP